MLDALNEKCRAAGQCSWGRATRVIVFAVIVAFIWPVVAVAVREAEEVESFRLSLP